MIKKTIMVVMGQVVAGVQRPRHGFRRHTHNEVIEAGFVHLVLEFKNTF